MDIPKNALPLGIGSHSGDVELAATNCFFRSDYDPSDSNQDAYRNISPSDRWENIRRLMYYYHVYRGQDGEYVWNLTDDEVSTEFYRAGNDPNFKARWQDNVNFFISQVGPAPLDYSITTTDAGDCLVNWASAECLYSVLADPALNYVWLNDKHEAPHVALESDYFQETFEYCYNQPFSNVPLVRPTVESILGTIEQPSEEGPPKNDISIIKPLDIGLIEYKDIGTSKNQGKTDTSKISEESYQQTGTGEQIDTSKQVKSETSWGWIIGGIVLAAAAVGGGYYYYSTQKNKLSNGGVRQVKEEKTRYLYSLSVVYYGNKQRIADALTDIISSLIVPADDPYHDPYDIDYDSCDDTTSILWHVTSEDKAYDALSKLKYSRLGSRVIEGSKISKTDIPIIDPKAKKHNFRLVDSKYAGIVKYVTHECVDCGYRFEIPADYLQRAIDSITKSSVCSGKKVKEPLKVGDKVYYYKTVGKKILVDKKVIGEVKKIGTKSGTRHAFVEWNNGNSGFYLISELQRVRVKE
jgi:hypothetical protein